MSFEELGKELEQRTLNKADWYNGGYATDINSGQAYIDTLGYIENEQQAAQESGLTKSFLNGGINLINQFSGATQLIRDRRLQAIQWENSDVAQQPGVQKVSEAEIAKMLPTMSRYEVQADSTWDRIIYGLAENAIPFAAQAVAHGLTGGLGGMAFMTGTIMGGQYQELRQQGISPDRAYTASLMNGVTQGALEKIGMDKIFSTLPGAGSVKKKAIDILNTAISEGITEGLQRIPEQVSKIWAENEGIDTKGIVKEYSKNAKQNLEEIFFSSVIGAVFGGGARGTVMLKDSAVNSIANKLEQKYTEYNIEALNKKVEAAKEKGISGEYAHSMIDMLNGGKETVNIAAQAIKDFAFNQKVDVSQVAEKLGTTVDEIEDASLVGMDITVSSGGVTEMELAHNGFIENVKQDMSFGENGRSLNYYQMQKDLTEAYGEGSKAQEALDDELDKIEKSALEAGMAKAHASEIRVAFRSRAIIANPGNPAAWLQKYPVKFQNAGKAAKDKSLFQNQYNVDYADPTTITWVNNVDNTKVADIAKSMDDNGYVGRPIAVIKNGDEYIGLTGSHRLAAARKAMLDNVPIVAIENNEDTVRLLDEVRDDYDLADVAKELYDDGKITEEAYSLLSSEKEYYQIGDVEKGAISPQADGSYIISLFKGADASTVIHETGHYFFDTFMRDTRFFRDDRGAADRKALLDYVGMTEEEWNNADLEGRRAAHERIAEAFETYMIEGKAPSRGLEGMFKRFSKWLKAIYNEIKRSENAVELTDDVRNVFDHWLAADADIEQVMKADGYLNALPERLTSNLSDKQKDWLNKKIDQARETAIKIITRDYMQNFSKERRAEIEAYRKLIEPGIREEIHKLRVNLARERIEELFQKTRESSVYNPAFKEKAFVSKKGTIYSKPLFFAYSFNDKVSKTIKANPKAIALKYKHVLGDQYYNYVDRLKQINDEIKALLDPYVDNMKQGMGHGTETEWWNREEGRPEDVGGLKTELKTGYTYEKETHTNNDIWYLNFRKEYGRRPTVKELYEIARDLYCGIDNYGYWPGLKHAEASMTKEDVEENKRYTEARAEVIDALIEERDAILAHKSIVEMSKRRALRDAERLAFESLAESLGYSSGEEMADDIINAPSEEKMVKEAMDSATKQRFPDYAEERKLAEEAKIKALYNDESGLVAALEEQLILDAANEAVAKSRSDAERLALAKSAKANAELAARNAMLKMNMLEALNTRRFVMAERRAAAEAKRAISKGDTAAAYEAKQKQMIAHAMVRHSVKIKQEVEKAKKFIQKLRKLKKDKAHFGAGEAAEENFSQIANLLARIGRPRSDYDPTNRKYSLAEYVNVMSDKLGIGIVDIAESVLQENGDQDLANGAAMNIEQYEDIIDALYNLYAVVKADAQATIDKEAADFEETCKNVKEHLEPLETRYTPSDSKQEKESFWKRQLAQRLSLDSLLNFMDNFTDGYFTKTFGATLKHCADMEASLRMAYDDAINAAVLKWAPTIDARRAMSEQRYYEELGTSVDRHTLIYMLIHLGNESSSERLCTSRPVSMQESKLWVLEGEQGVTLSKEECIAVTRQNIIDFLSKNLTKADIEYAQARVNAVCALWPKLAEVNRRTKGFAPEQVKATPIAIETVDGGIVLFEGGYFPLRRNSDMGSMPKGSEAFADTENAAAMANTMSTVQGTSKARVHATYPVRLNYNYESMLVQDTIHDIAYREAMIGFNKLFKNEEVFGMLKAKLGLEYTNLLRETLWKCARPRMGQDTNIAERTFGNAANWIRRKTVNAIIAMNIKISLQNFGNIFLYGNTVDGFTYSDVLAATRAMFSSKQAHVEMRNTVFSKSVFMRERAQAPDFTLRDLQDESKLSQLKVSKNKYVNKVRNLATTADENFQKWGTQMLEITDNITAVPVWLQAYSKQINAGATEQEAVDFADTVIRRTLGSNRIQDVSSMQRGGTMYRLFTAFQGFFNTQFNQWYREANIDKKLFTEKQYKEAFMRAASFLLSKWLLACLANCVIGTLSATKPFEEDKKGWTDITKELITYPVSCLGGPEGQAAIGVIQPLIGMENYGYRLSIIENTIVKAQSTGYKIYSVASGKKDADELLEPVTEIIAIATGVPLQFIRTGGNIVNILRGDMDFELEDIMTRRRKSEREQR